MTGSDGLDDLSRRSQELERNMNEAASVAGTFNDELATLREGMLYTSREVGTLANSIGRTWGAPSRVWCLMGPSCRMR